MTKEELLNKARKLVEFSARGTDAYRDMLEFFESNVCIPKGVNRHPYADVYHRYLEDTSIKLECQRNDGIWFDTAISELHEVRIKPSEPIYEWQWLFNNEVIEIQFYTYSEIEKYTCERDLWVKIEETKRERKWLRT